MKTHCTKHFLLGNDFSIEIRSDGTLRYDSNKLHPKGCPAATCTFKETENIRHHGLAVVLLCCNSQHLVEQDQHQAEIIRGGRENHQRPQLAVVHPDTRYLFAHSKKQ